MKQSFSGSLIVLISILCMKIHAQSITLKQLQQFAVTSADRVEETLLKDGWKRYAMQIVPDSNLVKRSWSVMVKEDATKSYLMYWEFSKDTTENYMVYQFSDRTQYDNYRKGLKNEGYKLLKESKSSKKNKQKQDNVSNDKVDNYYNQKTKTLVVIKEVFTYGLFSFLTYAYRPGSQYAENLYRNFQK